MKRRATVPLLLYLVFAAVYLILLGSRALGPTPDNHFVHLARSFLAGQLGVLGNQPPGTNDWALHDGTWYVSFPPFPAVVILPVVALFGLATRDAVFWALLAALAPTFLYVLLRRLREAGDTERTARDDLALTALFGFGTVFFYVAVQGTVWFAAHVVASVLLIGFLACAFDARRPLLAGLLLGCCLLTRPTTALVALVFVVEALRAFRRPRAEADVHADAAHEAHPLTRAVRFVAGAQPAAVLKACTLFALPVAAAVGVQLLLNWGMFDDPFAASHEFLQIRWRDRIDTWGLFNYHFFPRNFAIFTASLPWVSERKPYVMVSLHGLALWFTTPNLLWLLWPRWLDARSLGLLLAASGVAVADLCYQNSGWVQFGYRFALDYMPLLVVLLARGRRRFGPVFYAALLFAIAVNTFGAITFDRSPRFYDDDYTQKRLFQPD
ncbi:MAG: hypothetical protein ABW252_22305 [Polyangiales bacterium]